MYKRYLLLSIFMLSIAWAGLGVAQEWKELGSDHFIVYFNGDEKFAKEVLSNAEVYYRSIAQDLGYPRYSQFWLWDDRAKIYIYPDHASFLKATGQPKWSAGMADYPTRSIVSYAWSKDFMHSLLPHEMAHLIFRDFVGFKGEIPLWLDEGVAQWAEKKKRKMMKSMIEKLYMEDKLLLVSDLTSLDIRRFKDMDDRVFIREIRTRQGEPGVLFLDINHLVDTYYLESVAVVGFLIERYGSARFADFCRELRDGKMLEDAFRSAYPVHITSLNELEDNWRKYLEEGINK